MSSFPTQWILSTSWYLHLCGFVVGVTRVKFLTHCRTLGLWSLQDSITALRASRLGVSWDLKMALQAWWHSVVFAFPQHSSPIWNNVSETLCQTVWSKIWPRRTNYIIHICQTKTFVSHLLKVCSQLEYTNLWIMTNIKTKLSILLFFASQIYHNLFNRYENCVSRIILFQLQLLFNHLESPTSTWWYSE